MPPSPSPVVGLRPISYLRGGLAPRSLFLPSDFPPRVKYRKTHHNPPTHHTTSAGEKGKGRW